MRKFHILLMTVAIFSTQSLFAFGPMKDSKSCEAVAKACSDAGFTRDKAATKNFWRDCMRPIMLNKKVEGITIDAATVNTCRTDKIESMKKELSELEKVSSKAN